MPSKLTALWRALDEATFGTERTLNLRESLPTALEARRRAEDWLRARQMTKAKEVLVITGRGNQSVGGVGVIRQEILKMLPSLRRRGIVQSWKEHSPGSIIVRIAPLSALLEAPRRRTRHGQVAPARSDQGGIEGLQPATVTLLRQLASQSLNSLGIVESGPYVEQEMLRIFSALMAAIPSTGDREQALREAIVRGIEEAAG